MNEFLKYSDFGVEISTPEVMHFMDCTPDNPLYGEMTEEYEEIKSELVSLGKPQALFCFGEMPAQTASTDVPEGTPVVFVLFTEGGDISAYSTRMFEQGDYVRGMMADATAGSYLFQLDKLVMERLREVCAERGVGILKRLDAPKDFPMEAQKIIFDTCRADEELGMRITSGYMFDPVKTSAMIFVLSDDPDVFRAQHDCSKCAAKNCKMRRFLITVKEKESTYELPCRAGQSVLDALTEHGRYFSAFCGGAGLCGKCRMRVVEGSFPVTEEDKRFFTEKELLDGWRLACRAVPKETCTVCFDLNNEEEFEVVADVPVGKSAGSERVAGVQETAFGEAEAQSYGIACDIGTTTIAMSLVSLEDGNVCDVYTSVNHQRMYGADVISRMQASNDGKGPAMRQSIRKDLVAGIRELLAKSGMEVSRIKKVVLAGNTTMGHLLMGYPCETLGVFPFTPVNIGTIEGSCEEIFGETVADCPVTLMPGISTYVGADITSGILACGMAERDEISLLIDLGTNGEMAVGNKDKILVTSTAAGPAFEGGNISCGMGSVPGAISSVRIEDAGSSCRQAQIETIGNKPPTGLCGTGVIETVAELVRTGLVDETGLLDEELEDGFLLGQTPDGNGIFFTAKDVREVQLAKAAVRAGVEVLLRRYGISYGQVDKVYLAGGFGLKINQDKAMEIGLLPAEFKGKIEAVGNSSLSGALRYLMEETAGALAEKIAGMSEEIALANDKDFNEFYLEYMFFE